MGFYLSYDCPEVALVTSFNVSALAYEQRTLNSTVEVISWQLHDETPVTFVTEWQLQGAIGFA